ncbi:MAG TPA: histidine phosphotransferase family protein [Novosphingobium sp.]|nr:histidine phosphotransferase family protein [Novosphingobium sp.]HZV09688.1 histidine phosphotransferase family protein [Novosphingobium sp.]
MTSDMIDRTEALDLASLLCSRMCHDLLSPVGAMTNGLELLADEQDPDMRRRCFELLEQSAASTAAKLKFFRLAFGAAGGFGDSVAVAEARALIEGLIAGREKLELNWQITVDALPKPAVKTVLNLAMIAIEALVRGGRVDVAAELRQDLEVPATEIVVRAIGPRIAFDPVVGQALEGKLAPEELSSRTAPARMLANIAARLGGVLQFAQVPEALVLGAVLPLA